VPSALVTALAAPIREVQSLVRPGLSDDPGADPAIMLGATAGRAAGAVVRASQRLRAIVDGFEARAAALEPHLDSPGVAIRLPVGSTATRRIRWPPAQFATP
jgi:hypothetical protein